MTLRPILLASLLALLAACEVGVEQSSGESSMNPDDAATEAADTADDAATPVATDLDFTLEDTEGERHDLGDYLADGKTVVLEWFNPGCPYVVRYHEGDSAMAGYAAAVTGDDVVWLAVNSGAPGKQGSGREANQGFREKWDIAYPVLLDESGEVGRMFGATNTPHMFVITPDQGLIYQGAIDESGGRGEPLEESLVQRALAEYAAGGPVSVPETKAFGCTVKYAD